jgi:hypothetical protein
MTSKSDKGEQPEVEGQGRRFFKAHDEDETPKPENDDPKVREGESEDEGPEVEGQGRKFFR